MAGDNSCMINLKSSNCFVTGNELGCIGLNINNLNPPVIETDMPFDSNLQMFDFAGFIMEKVIQKATFTTTEDVYLSNHFGCDFNFEQYQTLVLTSLLNCINECNADGRCSMFEFQPYEQAKYSTDMYFFNNNFAVSDGVKMEVYGYYFAGRIDGNVKTFDCNEDQCVSSCLSTPNCTSYTWTAPSKLLYSGNCYLFFGKVNLNDLVSLQTAVSGWVIKNSQCVIPNNTFECSTHGFFKVETGTNASYSQTAPAVHSSAETGEYAAERRQYPFLVSGFAFTVSLNIFFIVWFSWYYSKKMNEDPLNDVLLNHLEVESCDMNYPANVKCEKYTWHSNFKKIFLITNQKGYHLLADLLAYYLFPVDVEFKALKSISEFDCTKVNVQDHIRIIKHLYNGYFVGENVTSGDQGIFPISCLPENINCPQITLLYCPEEGIDSPNFESNIIEQSKALHPEKLAIHTIPNFKSFPIEIMEECGLLGSVFDENKSDEEDSEFEAEMDESDDSTSDDDEEAAEKEFITKKELEALREDAKSFGWSRKCASGLKYPEGYEEEEAEMTEGEDDVDERFIETQKDPNLKTNFFDKQYESDDDDEEYVDSPDSLSDSDMELDESTPIGNTLEIQVQVNELAMKQDIDLDGLNSQITNVAIKKVE
ncbi:hypothetical protein HDV06_005841 [Boothiomyces sp. JEL0866]|nr:hypothetical protein HDV06_005841 [Boothiomyces sp. JEL0866]